VTEIRVTFCNAPDELYCHYQGEHRVQGAFIALHLADGRLYASYNAEIGNGIPASVYHGQVRRYPIPVLTADAANRLLREIGPLAQRIADDWEDDWDGSNYNAVLGTDACKAEDEIGKLTDSERFGIGDLVVEASACDWMTGSPGEAAELGVTAATADDELAEIAARTTREAATGGDYGYIILAGLDDYLRDLRETLRDAQP
jgi:hypothetical protein